ncbi:MAG: C4-dicarboxylic acid transporter DauA [Alphaproteobacteria bacterium]|nr:C4-dicarboxylic acid transporter DauA [Alphaproteobacteria bacterium]
MSGLPFHALREALREGYTTDDLRADVLSGLVVGVVAVPLSMALAVAVGAPPQHGLYTAVVSGGLIALLGGSRVQVSGPTAAFVVILAPIVEQHGLAGLFVATAMAGVMLVAMGLGGLGKLVAAMPSPVITGFTAGIGVVIATLQIKDLLGLTPGPMGGHWHDKVIGTVEALPTIAWPDAVVGLATFALLVAWPRISRRVPGPLVALALAGVAAVVLHGQGVDLITLRSRFSWVDDAGVSHAGIPSMMPRFAVPWAPHGLPGLAGGFDAVQALVPAAVAIAMLGAIESLLSAVIADGMTGRKTDPDAELVAQGVGNLVGPFFGGIAATGALARTATNVRSGGRTPVAAVVHAFVVLAAIVVLAPLLGWLPMSALAALLLLIAWNMSEARHFVHTLRAAPRSDVMVMVTCFVLTVVFDMVIAVGVGLALAALLFIKRMADVAEVRVLDGTTSVHADPGDDVLIYEIAGPLFFGAAARAMGTLRQVDRRVRKVVLDLSAVPVIDETGIANLRAVLGDLEAVGTEVVTVGLQTQPRRALARAGLLTRLGVEDPEPSATARATA